MSSKSKTTANATMEQNIATLVDSIKRIQKDIAELKISVNSSNTNVTNLKNKLELMDAKLSEMNQTVQMTSDKYNKVLKFNEQLQERIVALESHLRRDNLLFDGIPESPPGNSETQDDCLRKIRDVLKKNMQLTYGAEYLCVFKWG